jgi:hypothetical protein
LDLQYNFGGHERDELTKLRAFFTELSSSIGVILSNLKIIVAREEEKSEALKSQSSTFQIIGNLNQGFLKMRLSQEQLDKLVNTHQEHAVRNEVYKNCINNYFIFYFDVSEEAKRQDLRSDISEAGERIKGRLDREEQIKSVAVTEQNEDEIREHWEQHKKILCDMVPHMKVFQNQATQSLNNLMLQLQQVQKNTAQGVRPRFILGGEYMECTRAQGYRGQAAHSRS